jgi:RimJ/RimL family protein N-acetyltransferase
MINTNRLNITHAELSDIEDVFEYVSNKEVMKYEREDYPTLESFSELFGILVKQKLLYVVRIKGNNKIIGHLFLGKTNPAINNEYNIGYIFNPNFHNQGYCSEASRAVLDYGFSILHANRIRAACNPDNIPSWKVMEKIGLQKEGFFKKRFFISNDKLGNPIYTDEVVYGLHVSDWEMNEDTYIY